MTTPMADDPGAPMRLRLEVETNTGRILGGSVPIDDRGDFRVWVERIANDIENELFGPRR